MDIRRPVIISARPAGGQCNIACSYCYSHNQQSALMSPVVLDRFVREYIQYQPGLDVPFVWGGGEPLLQPLAFYKKVSELQSFYGSGRRVSNTLQTNGLLLDEEWCRWLAERHWRVELSVDGNQKMHNSFRRGYDGRFFYEPLLKRIEMLNRHHVEWSAVAAVHSRNVGQPLELYGALKSLGAKYIHFHPVVERLSRDGRRMHYGEMGGRLTDESVTPTQWGDFLVAVFDEWLRTDVGQVFVFMFDSLLECLCGLEPSLCTMASDCSDRAVLDSDGSLYCCDWFLSPGYWLGNILGRPLSEMVSSIEHQQFGSNKREALAPTCANCRWFAICRGGCPRHRFAQTSSGELGMNYLCEGYCRFFDHAVPLMTALKKELFPED